MIKHFDYETKGTCCTAIHIDVEDDKVVKVQYDRGCPGNIQGIMRLVEGMEVDEAIKRLDGIQCKDRGTSCPDQLARALKQMREN